MSIFDKHRFEIWNLTQHPYKHRLSDFGYSNAALPGVSNVASALNYMVNVMYPNTQPNVPTPGDLPTGPNTPNPGDVTPTISDYRVVDDDGDGRSAGYRWEQREGDVSPQWYKVFDVDWSTDAILAAVTDVTNDLYFYSKGKDDLDELGAAITGLYAGQKVYGGASANTHLTLNANNGDGVGPQTGYVQIDGDFRPTVNNSYDLSTITEQWKDAWFAGTVTIGTMAIAGGSITDSSGAISFGDENLTTTGNITGAILTGSSLVADDTVNTVTLVPGSYTDSSGAVNFGAANLLTTGTLGAGVTTLTDGGQTLTFDPNAAAISTILSSTGTISFGDENLITTGTFNVGALTADSLAVDNLFLDGNTISSTDVNGNIVLVPNGTGLVDVQKTLQTLAQNVTGTITHTGSLDTTGDISVDNLRLDGNTLSSTDVNGNIIISPDGTGVVSFSKSLIPTTGGALDLGSSTFLMNDLYISGGVRDASNEISVGTMLAFRSSLFRDLGQTTPAQNGDALFYDSVNGVWLASTPDSEVDHTTIANLTTGDAGHTQFAMLAGRAGGQAIQGGTAASENLTLESTAHATKGSVLTRDNLTPETDASYSAGWTGTDLGGASNRWNDIYSAGEFKGFRLENFTSGTLPSASVQNVGRTVYATDNNKAYVDTGTAFKVLGVSKFVGDQAFDGIVLFKDVTVSADIEDARNAQWQLMDNANNFEIMAVTITATSATNVRITTNIPLPAGSYRLIGIE